jgi:hypothetical protein
MEACIGAIRKRIALINAEEDKCRMSGEELSSEISL